MSSIINNENDTVVVISNYGQDEGEGFEYAKECYLENNNDPIIYTHIEDITGEFDNDFGLTVQQALVLSAKLLLAVKEITGE